MTTEYHRVIEEARKLNDAVIAAKSLRTVFIRYAFIHAIITGIIAVGLIMAFFFFYIDRQPDIEEQRIVKITESNSQKLERLAGENHEILLTLRCLLLTPLKDRTDMTVNDCSKSPNREKDFGTSEAKGGDDTRESTDSPRLPRRGRPLA